MRDHLSSFDQSLNDIRASQGQHTRSLDDIRRAQDAQGRVLEQALQQLQAEALRVANDNMKTQLEAQELRLKMAHEKETRTMQERHRHEAERWQQANKDFAVSGH